MYIYCICLHLHIIVVIHLMQDGLCNDALRIESFAVHKRIRQSKAYTQAPSILLIHCLAYVRVQVYIWDRIQWAEEHILCTGGGQESAIVHPSRAIANRRIDCRQKGNGRGVSGENKGGRVNSAAFGSWYTTGRASATSQHAHIRGLSSLLAYIYRLYICVYKEREKERGTEHGV